MSILAVRATRIFAPQKNAIPHSAKHEIKREFYKLHLRKISIYRGNEVTRIFRLLKVLYIKRIACALFSNFDS